MKPLDVKNDAMDYMTHELDDFKEFVKKKVEPLKQKVLKVQNEISTFKDPILNELINIRQQNEALLRELGRQKNVYREMLGEFYKMVAITDSRDNPTSTIESMSQKKITTESPILNSKNSGGIRHWNKINDSEKDSDDNGFSEMPRLIKNTSKDIKSNKEIDLNLFKQKELKSKSIPKKSLIPNRLMMDSQETSNFNFMTL